MKGHALRTAVITMVLVIKVLPLLSQNGLPRYGTEWKTVDRYQQQGLPKSALAEVRKIYALAKRDRQDAQLIRALIYMSILQSETREDNLLASIRELDREIQTAREPARSVLYSLQGDLYWGYFQQNRWKVYGRTRTEGNKSPDPATWDAAAFHRTIRTCYLRSLQDEKQLQQTRLEEFDAIIEKGNMRHLRPTLYDLLTDRALAYFENDERSISEPEQTFELNQIAAFAPAAEFSRYPFRSRDSLSLTYQALLLYQRWLQFHQNDPRPDAWIDTDLRRLSFVKNHSVLPDKKSLFMDALRRITDTYTDLPAAAEAWYRLAAQYEEDGITYKAFGDSTHRLDRLRARDICERVLRQKDSSEGRVHCQQLLRALKRPRFRFTMEQVNMPDKPFRTLVTYRNTDRLYFRLIPYPEKLKALLKDRADESYWSTLIATTSLRQWEQPLPQPGDLQEHSTEIRIESLPTGAYLLLASSTADFNIQSALLGARVFHVSSISYVNRDEHLFVLDRESGEPMTGATVQVWTERYDYAQNKYVRVKDIRLQSDSNGYVRLQRPADNARMSYLGRLFEITFRNDHFFPDDLVYDYSSYNQEENEPGETLTVHLFTDRSIYRPGQSVQFKGIVLTQRRKERSGTVRSGHSVQVLLRDANYRTIDTLALRSNDYGSFQGVFQLPSAGLNGSFQIYTATGNGSVSFRMEEYKRPKFYVEYEPVTGQYRVDDSLTVTGRAKGYSGNTIDGASVKYRVVREPRFPYPWLCRRWWQPPSEAREIVHGVTKTDKEGRFTIGFRAIPDASIDTRFEPVFDYRIYADVTDINGETRSGEGQVSAGYKSFVLETTLPSTAPADSFRQLTIRTRNLSGTYVPTQVTVTLMKLKAENRLVRDRLWDRPDQFVMNKSDYLHHFPYDLYANETDPFEWDQESILYKATEPSRADGSWILSGNRPLPGTYRLDITAVNERGEMVRDQHIIRLTNATGYPADQSDYLWTGNIRATVEPGDTAGLELGTSAGKIFVIEQVKKSRNEEVRFLFRSLSDKKLTVRIPVTEKDRGGFGASWMFVRHNRLWQYNQLFQVPWNNKELKMEYVSYREKTLPGAAEIWKLRITGAKKEAAAAELMAAMYDASLDQFTAHGWSPPSIWPYFYGLGQWNGHSNFTAVGSLVKDLPEPPLPSVEKNFDRLILSDQLTSTEYLDRRVVGLTAGAPPPTEEVRVMADSAAVTKNENEIVRQKEASVMK
ncbi:MAG: hypothetical protein RJA57_1214, partial [Bacteroidota bacterium]